MGPNLEGTKVGLVVPEYVKAESIEDLRKQAGDFDNRIIGIEAGAGVVQLTEKAIEDYGLDMELVNSSSAAMAAPLKRRIVRRSRSWSPDGSLTGNSPR